MSTQGYPLFSKPFGILKYAKHAIVINTVVLETNAGGVSRGGAPI